MDMIAGGNNGVVYLWRQAACVECATVAKGGVGVSALAVHGDYLFAGAAGGVLKVTLLT